MHAMTRARVCPPYETNEINEHGSGGGAQEQQTAATHGRPDGHTAIKQRINDRRHRLPNNCFK